MTDAEFSDLISNKRDGKILVGVDRTVARRFFTDVPLATIREHTGDAPVTEKVTIIAFYVATAIFLVAAIAATFYLFSWWGVLSLVVCPALLFLYMADSARGNAKATGVTGLLIATVVFWAANVLPSGMAICFALFLLALLCIRVVYISSTNFYRSYALRSPRHFELLAPGIELASKG